MSVINYSFIRLFFYLRDKTARCFTYYYSQKPHAVLFFKSKYQFPLFSSSTCNFGLNTPYSTKLLIKHLPYIEVKYYNSAWYMYKSFTILNHNTGPNFITVLKNVHNLLRKCYAWPSCIRDTCVLYITLHTSDRLE